MAETVIAGGGVAGLTAALSFAAKGFSVTILERAERLEEVGAGLQLSPNATRILRSLGVLERIEIHSVRPAAILLKDAASLGTLARLPLGEAAERRWRAPYLVAHRADLQRALLDQVGETPSIELQTGAVVRDAAFGPDGATAVLTDGGSERRLRCRLLIGADGVWSTLRKAAGGANSRFTGHVAFRAVLGRDAGGEQVAAVVRADAVMAFLAPEFHMIAYPLRGGTSTNLVVVTRSAEIARGWAKAADMAQLLKGTARAAPALSDLVRQAGTWTAWPIHEVERRGGWSHAGGLALIGDAAHALTPYAAQGAAMAIEDAAVLAQLAAREADMAVMLRRYEHLRRPRIERVARRGSFNRFVWHASGPVTLARNLALRMKTGESLTADLDWLYGYDVEAE